MTTYIISCVTYYNDCNHKFYLKTIHSNWLDGHCKVNLTWTDNIYETQCYGTKKDTENLIKEIKAYLNNKKSIILGFGLHHDAIKDLKAQKIEVNIKELD